MRFSSTPESAVEGEITILAIVETLLAIALALLLVKLLDSTAHLVASALITPFLLLRTEASSSKAFSMFDACYQSLAKPISWGERLYGRLPAAVRSCIFFFVLLPLFSLFLIIIKSIATIQTVISEPREALLAIPGNWLRNVLATDCWHPPELLSGAETARDVPPSVQSFRYGEMRGRIISGSGGALFKKLSLLALYGSAVVYRLFLKSTALIYFPLIWISNVPVTVKGVLSLPLERVRRWYAVAVLLLTVGPLLISFHLHETLSTMQDRVIFTYVLPVGGIDWWHASRVIAVAITIALYFFARKRSEESLEHEEKVRWIITGANRLRAACGVFTMGCFLLIVFML